jgi:hypothetical protein
VEKSGDWTENKPGYYTYSGSWKTTVPGSSISLDVKGGRIWLLCGKTSRLRIIGTDTNEKILTPGNRRNGTPSLLLIHEGGEFSGRITVTVEPDASGNTRAELAGVAAVIVPPSCKQRHNLPSNPTQPDPT